MSTTYADWERDVTYQLELIAGVTTSDAQAIIEAHEFEMAQCWAKDMTAEETAKKIDSIW